MSATLLRTQAIVNSYAPYWENDDTANPVLVRYLKRDGDWFYISLPSGEIRQVHLHTLGRFRKAS